MYIHDNQAYTHRLRNVIYLAMHECCIKLKHHCLLTAFSLLICSMARCLSASFSFSCCSCIAFVILQPEGNQCI